MTRHFQGFELKGKTAHVSFLPVQQVGLIALDAFPGTIIVLLGWEAAVSILAVTMICLRFILQNEKCAYYTEK